MPTTNIKYRLVTSGLLALLHMVVGNLVGIFFSGSSVWDYLFLPYSFIAGMSQFAGWDNLSMILEVISMFLSFLFFYCVLVVISRVRKKRV